MIFFSKAVFVENRNRFLINIPVIIRLSTLTHVSYCKIGRVPRSYIVSCRHVISPLSNLTRLVITHGQNISLILATTASAISNTGACCPGAPAYLWAWASQSGTTSVEGARAACSTRKLDVERLGSDAPNRSKGWRSPSQKKLNGIVKSGCEYCSNKAALSWGCWLMHILNPYERQLILCEASRGDSQNTWAWVHRAEEIRIHGS